MGKFAAILIALYILYYAGNIIYDLFLKKETVAKNEESEEFSLTDFAEKNRDEVQDIGIEDVENLNTPNSFSKNELTSSTIELSEERQDLDYYREKFESEESIDSFHNDDEIIGKEFEAEAVFPIDNQLGNQNQNSEEAASTMSRSNRERFRNLLNLAETSVQLISNNDGYKIYQSIM